MADKKQQKGKKSAAKRGHPTLYTKELALRICELIATTPAGLKSLCATNSWMPEHQTIKNWRAHNAEFFALYLQAKEAQGHEILDELWEQSKNLAADKDEINRFNAVFRFQQFHLAKLASKQFGDKQLEAQKQFSDAEKSELRNIMSELVAKHDREY